MPSVDFQVSLTAEQSYLKCEQQYAYRYVERLRRKDRAVPLELGSILHDYLGHYYLSVKGGARPEDAHVYALLVCSNKYVPDSRRYANIAASAGEEGLAQELLDLPGKAGRIAERYYHARGKADAELHEILMSEEEIVTRIAPRIISRGRIDLVTRDRARGLTWLWEHKSAKETPPLSVRLRDLQTILYGDALELDIDAVIWNYLRTKEPHVPTLVYKGTKRERLEIGKDMDTTWEVYMAVIEQFGLIVDEYNEMRERLDGRELSIFFPRYEQVVVASAEVLLRDYRQVAFDMRRARHQWAAGLRVPVRTLGRDCDYCEFNILCMTFLMHGDDSDARRFRFRVAGEEPHAEPEPTPEPESDSESDEESVT